MIYEYRGSSMNQRPWNGLRLEIQMRTPLQHSWATAVESASQGLGQGLKFGDGNPRWLRFFALVAGLMAIDEGTAAVPGVPSSRAELIAELRPLEAELQALEHFNSWARRRVTSDPTAKNSTQFLLEADPRQGELTVRGFGRQSGRTLTQANEALFEAEQQASDDTEKQIVLVGAQTEEQARIAYPSFYGLVGSFIDYLEAALA
jgi:hypothetical protein